MIFEFSGDPPRGSRELFWCPISQKIQFFGQLIALDGLVSADQLIMLGLVPTLVPTDLTNLVLILGITHQGSKGDHGSHLDGWFGHKSCSWAIRLSFMVFNSFFWTAYQLLMLELVHTDLRVCFWHSISARGGHRSPFCGQFDHESQFSATWSH